MTKLYKITATQTTELVIVCPFCDEEHILTDCHTEQNATDTLSMMQKMDNNEDVYFTCGNCKKELSLGSYKMH